jgi:hypothetical protein
MFMPLHRLVQLECDYCGGSDYSEPPLSYATEYFSDLGYIHINGRWYCDSKCKDNHRAKLKNSSTESLE